MLYGFDNNQDKDMHDFHQRVADQNIQSIEDRQEELQHAKNGFIGMLAGILVGGVVGWIFYGPAENLNREKEIPVLRRSVQVVKVQPNEPGGMEINNQDREIYHIIDNAPKKNVEVNIRPQADTPKMVIENTIHTVDNMEELVEQIEDNTDLNKETIISDERTVKIASQELSAIQTNSSEKIIIPEKVKDINVKVQNTVKSETGTVATVENKTVEKAPVKAEPQNTPETKAVKGTWYAQIIASSSRNAVQSLWQSLSSKHAFIKTYPHEIEEITSADGKTLYRLKVGAFKTRNEAVALSEKLKTNQISSIIKQN